MIVEEQHTNETRGYLLGEPCRTDVGEDTVGEVFKACQKEYGRCVSSMYVDKVDGTVERIGWVFEKREKYTDCDETFLHHTWISLLSRYEERVERDFVGL